ncbi:uncharacterized protein LOC125490340 [Plutella xylostella]|uniref:uncharacterized protein LOC125490340 n=1 Tax=Plutella xylostella TaxID=51655 RepID=UPI002032ED19|nr:uncharacterized protein LOC125490340 [Plutella xylostella]
MRFTILIFLMLCWKYIKCDQNGPDPWDYKITETVVDKNIDHVPPDLRIPSKRRELRVASTVNNSDWFYKRLLAILLKGGKFKKNDGGYVDVIIQMQFPEAHWTILNEYLTNNNAFSEDMFRKSIGYVQEAIIKPSVTETLVQAWTDYVHFYLVEYKMHITLFFGALGILWMTCIVWTRISHKHIFILIMVGLYLYEVFVSYKEAEQQEYDRFLSSVNTCKWYFWSSSCHVPAPDPLVFIKHMHPLKIAMRIFTLFVSEPMLAISATITTMLHGITDGLWFPLDKIVYGLLVVIMNGLLVIFLLLVLFNFILNIPFNLSFAGLLNIGFPQRVRNVYNLLPKSPPSSEQGDRISGANLDKLLNVCAQAINNNHTGSTIKQQAIASYRAKVNKIEGGMKKSASTGRLCDLAQEHQSLVPIYRNNVKKTKSRKEMGAGDS